MGSYTELCDRRFDTRFYRLKTGIVAQAVPRRHAIRPDISSDKTRILTAAGEVVPTSQELEALQVRDSWIKAYPGCQTYIRPTLKITLGWLRDSSSGHGPSTYPLEQVVGKFALRIVVPWVVPGWRNDIERHLVGRERACAVRTDATSG